MPVKRRMRKLRMPGLSVIAFDLLTVGEAFPDPESQAELWETYLFEWSGDGHLDEVSPSLESLWRQHSEALLIDWIEHHPGTRPAGWWAWSGPGAQPGRPLKFLPLPPPLDQQPAILARVGALTSAERRMLPRDL